MTNQSADVDELVVAEVDTRDGESWVDNDALTVWFGADEGSRMSGFVLFGDERGDVAFEKSDASAEENEAKDERR